jgi:hypothetical protein
MEHDEDRTVHARWAQMEVVRYNRAGKWYLEPVGSNLKRQQVTLKKAVEYALWAEREREGAIFGGLPGGGAFDHKVASTRAADAADAKFLRKFGNEEQ